MRRLARHGSRRAVARLLVAGAVGAVAVSVAHLAGAASILGPSVRILAPLDAAKAPVATMVSVSCPTTSDCVAVGGYLNAKSNGQPMAATASAGAWSRATTVGLPANHATTYGSAALRSVSCPTLAYCAAVGNYVTTTPSVLPIIATRSGSSWGAAATVGLPGAAGGNQLAQLTSVSCVSATNCVAVGSFSDKKSLPAIMVATQTAGTWHPAVQLALPPQAGVVQRALGNVELAGVSCTDAQNCVAVGSYLNSAGAIVPIRATQTAGVWGQAVRSAMPAGTPSVTSAELYAVDCFQTGSCVAVGYVTTASGASWPAIETQTAGTWGPVVRLGIPAGTPAAVGGVLSGVTCTAASTCTAVGSLNLKDGTSVPSVAVDLFGKWQPLQRVGGVPAMPNISTRALRGISCPAANLCVGAGYAYARNAKGYVSDAEAFATRIVPVRPVTDPSPPSSIKVTPRSQAVAVSWTPGDDGGAPISGYTATASPGTLTCVSTSAACVIRGLVNGTSYTIRVTATNSHGTSAPSAPSAAVVPGTAPSAPTGVSVGLAHLRAAVHWHAATGSPGDPVTRYVVTAGSPGLPARACSTATLSCTLTGLVAGRVYSVTVVAQNAVGTSPKSAPRSFKAL